ncbi:MAG: hypothetical protein D6772_08110 [Bacteroidetes bacterium]|nr:MAG: hypothetical protein D6772_08110 [Bacteroidota bacterium]
MFLRILCLVLGSFLTAPYLHAQLIISDKVEFGQANQLHMLWTKRGDQLLGHLLSIQQDTLTFRLSGLDNVLRYHRREVTFVGLANEAFPVFNKVTTRYRNRQGKKLEFPRHSLLYSATALAPQNRASYRNNILLVNELQYNINPYLSVGVGAFVPPVIILRATARVSINELLHIGVNVNQYFDTYWPDRYTHPYLMLTLGKQEKYINFTYGRWFQIYAWDDSSESFPMISIGGSYMVSSHWRVFFEGLVYDDGYANDILPTGYFNYLRRRSVYGFGLWGLPQDAGIPLLPWFSYSYIF